MITERRGLIVECKISQRFRLTTATILMAHVILIQYVSIINLDKGKLHV